MMNGDSDHGEIETRYGITEKEMCEACYKRLTFHLKLR